MYSLSIRRTILFTIRDPASASSARRRGCLAACLLTLSAVLVGVSTAEADSRLNDYVELTRWAFSRPLPLPDDGLEIRLDAARWRFESGTVQLQSPLANGQSYGLVFEGRGRFVLEVPDPIELRQLRRFTRQPELTRLEQEFTRLVLKTSDPGLFGDLRATGPFEPSALARERHDSWLRRRLLDADSMVVEAGSDPAGYFVAIDTLTKEWDWLTVTYDARRREELQLTRFNPGYKVDESWISLDRAGQRRDDSRPSYDYQPAFTATDVDIVIDVRQRAKQSPGGFSAVQPVRAKLNAEVKIEARIDGLRALHFELTPSAEQVVVTGEQETPLAILRDAVGKRSSAVDNDVEDDSLLVLLPEPLAAGQTMRLTFEYEMRLWGYASGRSWYPGPAGPIPVRLGPHTVAFELQYRDYQHVRASGLLDWEEAGRSRWVQNRPVKMASFAVFGKPHEVSHSLPDVPPVRTFASLGGRMSPERVEQVGTDVSIAIDYFQRLFADPLPGQEFRSALIPSGHGQAFDGFLHIGDYTVAFDNLAATSLFRAHEVAHQWWGHRVLWASYRDQWLSEAFAEYSAMMFVQAAVEGGDKEFPKILAAYTDEVTGSIKSAFSNYARPDYTPMTRIGLERIGPIGHGHRCYVPEAGSAYFTQTYLKGSLVLHMLRVLVSHMTRDPDTFIDILRTFIRRHSDSYASTDDFVAVLTEKVPADWSWFFDQWVYSAEIPTYAWRHKIVEGAQAPFELHLQVDQTNVPPDFRMAVPVRIEFSGDRAGTVLAFVDEPSKEFVFPLPERPKRVTFNPDNAVLARMKKKR